MSALSPSCKVREAVCQLEYLDIAETVRHLVAKDARSKEASSFAYCCCFGFAELFAGFDVGDVNLEYRAVDAADRVAASIAEEVSA